jgi:glycosyltransferase involved in cell wall biosynthesis
MARWQAAAGLQVKILATWKMTTGLPVAQRLRDAGVAVRHVGPATGKLSRHPDLAAAAQQEVGQADVVHIHAVWEDAQYQAARAACRAGVPVVWTPHGLFEPWSLRKSRWRKKLYFAIRLRSLLPNAAALHFTSQRECELVAPLRLGPPAIIEPNGIDLTEFDALPPPGTFRALYPALADKPIVLFLGRLHYKKGLQLLIPAFARLKQRDAMLVIAGPDSDGYQAVVEKLIEGHGLQNRAIFTGMLEGTKKIAAMADAALFVLPSYQENFGIAVVEAMAAGTPPIISDGVDIHGEIADARAGAVISVHCPAQQSIEQLAAAIALWLADPDLRRQTGQRARAHVFQRFGWGRIAQNWVGHYQGLRR